MRRFPRTSLYLCVASVAALLPSTSQADEWRLPRKDHGRSGVASGPVEMAAPNVAWRTFLGGAPIAPTVLFHGPSASGTLTNEHAVILRGGRFIALNMKTQQPLWQSDLFGPGQVAGIADLDGDGTDEVVVQTETQAHVLDGATGATLWSSSLELVEQMGATRVRDIDGDGLPDVYIDNAIGAKWGVDAASAYSFATGSAVKLWDFPVTADPMTISSGTDALLDLDGNGEAEVVLPSFSDARILRGSDGTLLTTLVAPPSIAGWPFQHASSFSADLDGQGDLEVLVVQQYSHAPTQVGPAIMAYQVDVATGQNQLLWSVDTGSFDAEFAATTDIATDLDGDGISEIVFSYRNAGSDWTTEVIGGDGTLLQSLPARFEGAADLDGDPGSELVVASDQGLAVMKLDTSTETLTQLGSTIANRRGVTMTDAGRRASTWVDQRLATIPRPGKAPLLVAGELPGAYTLGSASSFASLDGYELMGGEWQLAASYEPLVGTITGLIGADHATRPYDQIAVGASTGMVTVLNQYMEGTNGWSWIDGSRLGAFVAGAYPRGTPLVGSDSESPFVVLSGTALGTVVADARFASWIIPPIPRWFERDLSNSSILDIGGSTKVVGVVDGTNLVAFDSVTGSASPAVAMPEDGFAWGSPVALQSGADTFVGIDWRNNAGEIFQTAVNTQTGATVFTGDPILTGGFFGSTVGDLDADGVDEWYSMTFASLWRRNAATGQASALASLPDMNYALPMVTEDSGGNARLLLQGGFDGPALLSPDGSVAWQADLNEAINGMAGVVLSCGGQQRYVTPGVLSPTLSFYDATTGQLLGSRTYAGGSAYADADAAIAAGQKPGVLSNVNGVASLDGAPAAVAGSSDGHVYVIDPCTTDVRWAADLGVSAGEPVIADVDDDGEDEILVATADGFLSGLDNFSFPAPFITLSGQTGDSLSVDVGETLTASWADVPGATSYEVALIGPDEKPVWDPAYRAADGTSYDVDLAGALAARPYRVVVRVAGDDPGQEAFSVPVMVNDDGAPSVNATASGGMKSVLEFDANDNLALDVAMVGVTGETGEALVLDEALLTGSAQAGALEWTAPAVLFDQDVTVEVVVVDSAGLKSKVSFDASVDSEGFITYSGEPGTDPIGEPGGDDDGGPADVSASGGCACETTPQPTGLPSAALLLGLLTAGLTRRKRTASKR